jgi:hypothetical protein
MNLALWIVQALLALLFLYAGGLKLILPVEEMTAQVPMPGLLLFIGVCEVLGAIGLILPGLLKVRNGLTPLAAAGLVIIMVGGTVVTLVYMPLSWVVLPVVTGLLASFVAYGRWRLAPQGARHPSIPLKTQNR